MFVDITGKRRLKIGLHTHTTLSDGRKTPEEVAAIYAAAGYDAVALTDHWVVGQEQILSGIRILAGCEYNIGGGDSVTGVYHIVGVGMKRDPGVPTALFDQRDGLADCAAQIIRMIREAGGLAVLAHPAWSLNTPEQIRAIGDFDATEIYNSVSDFGMSDRPDSGLIVDMLAREGITPPLLATDDAHYYTGDQCRGMVMVEADAAEELGLVEAIRQGRFYATMGPEIHLERIAPDRVRVRCTPAVKIAFLSHVVWTAGRMIRGENLTEGEYTLKPNERYIRAEITDAEGRRAWSNILQ